NSSSSAARWKRNMARALHLRSCLSISPRKTKPSTSASRRGKRRKRRNLLPSSPPSRGRYPRLHHHRQPLRRARGARIEPALAAVGKRKRLVEQHHVVPLRALRLVHSEHV